ncbi:MAG: phospholipase D family protein [Halioglobus sp.]
MPILRKAWPGTTICLFLALASGCASVPKDYPRTVSNAFEDHESTTIGASFAEEAANYPGKSGFSIIRKGRYAFTDRVAMTRLAEVSLDVQYYIWEPDETGRILAEHLVRAADRGVRVRLLVDDMNVAGRDAAIASLDAHPNIEIRIFNPFANRSSAMFDFLLDFDRVNHRMHNKIMVMDNTLVIVGGRNIGDHYFSVNTETNFRDLDIAAAGPVVRDVSQVFDRFWNGEWSVPIAALADRKFTQNDLQQTVALMRQKIADGEYPYSIDDDIETLTGQLTTVRENLIWAPGKIIWDDPASIAAESRPEEQGAMAEALHRKLNKLQHELTIESAYFVAADRGVEAVKKLCDRGVKVRVLTNSLASNDVIAAHAGHAKFREDLLQTCTQIYEVRPDAGVIHKQWTGESRAGLHTKALVFDRESVFIGSFNLDPRSANINTEAGLYVESLELAEQVLEYMDEGVLPENSYQVKLNADGDLYWETSIDGETVRYDEEPETTFGQRFESNMIELLPIESQL